VAPKPAADGFLAAKAKTASARAILALAAAAVLALAGCGGGGSDAPSSTTAPASGSSASADSPAGKEGASPSAASPSSEKSQGSKQAGQDSSQSPGLSGTQGQGAKTAKPITIPKGEPESAPSAAEREQATVADIALASPDLQSAPGAAATLAIANTCEGSNTSPSLVWQGVPPASAELALLAMNSQPVQGKLFFDWAVAGLNPDLTSLETGRLPAGAVVGQNSFGKDTYEICPPKGTAETYIFALYAVPDPLGASRGFDPHRLREAILAQAGNVGLMAAAYGG
jgi:phosphatidylethanolamine-binding protein (PEBP) family uncharacterized protein